MFRHMTIFVLILSVIVALGEMAVLASSFSYGIAAIFITLSVLLSAWTLKTVYEGYEEAKKENQS